MSFQFGDNNAIFILQHDVRTPLHLSSHICRTVEVSFCAVNKYGSSVFSEPAVLFIPAGEAIKCY